MSLSHSLTQADAERLLGNLEVMAFEFAHLLIDHSAKYSKLHCGRHGWHVKVRSQINPISE